MEGQDKVLELLGPLRASLGLAFFLAGWELTGLPHSSCCAFLQLWHRAGMRVAECPQGWSPVTCPADMSGCGRPLSC